MTMIRQHTLSRPVSGAGVGLHSGAMIQVTLRPAAEGTGVVFRRTDLPGSPEVPAVVQNVVDARLATTIGVGKATVATVEHLMAALAAEGVDNAVVDIAGPEVPVMDGSSAPWIALIREAGLARQSRPRRLLRVRETVEVRDGDRWARLCPAESFSVACSIEFLHPLVGVQSLSMHVTGESFRSDISTARTFCLYRDVEKMRAMGLCKGGSLENAVVLDETGVLNPDGLRFKDEPVRHKILDAVGDLYMLGGRLLGAVVLNKSGHALHHELSRALLARADAFEWVSAAELYPESRSARSHGWLGVPNLSVPPTALSPSAG
ncbi:MAG: UDP-3-O-acyl-N-acetylglucosamine deacetylase [Myxococcota bacterium]